MSSFYTWDDNIAYKLKVSAIVYMYECNVSMDVIPNPNLMKPLLNLLI